MRKPEPATRRSISDRFLLGGTVEDVTPLTPRTRRIRIGGVGGAGARELVWRPGQHVRVLVGDPGTARAWMTGFRDLLRSYSVWDHDARAGTLDLCVLDHGDDGPGVRWARRVRVGQRVAFTRPEGRVVLDRHAPHHLFVGDETASVAFRPMLQTLPATARVHGVIGVAAPEDRLPLPRADELHWIYGRPLADAVHALDLPAEPGVAYVAGEAHTCQAVRRHLTRTLGWPRRSVIVKPFWAPGRRGLD
ncbi:siderophore-interacting protein [Streptomyces hainanensis]|uniref:Siderophore-interacting protein n=1 Tax=Streptomyces hainanensis TaxID=402648 RepID=A0A4R4TLS3_9ACTN|nr:siderophore-interacting protein [Streptomyces hainanensis]TDC78730.1 siderophore-interacting protein [Streptomyces hainanensis]